MQQETNTAYHTDPRRFTRTKKLSFKATVVLVLQKLHKSLSLEVTHFRAAVALKSYPIMAQPWRRA